MISKEHLKILSEESGITKESAKYFGLKSVSKGIALPYYEIDGKKLPDRTKLVPPLENKKEPGRKVKYLQPKGTSLTCFFHPVDIVKILNPELMLLITEGEKKLIALHQIKELSNYPMVSYPGCWNWGQKDENGKLELSHNWNAIPFKDREIIWLPDTDFFTNHHTRKGMMRFANELTDRGAIIKVIDLRLEEDE